MANEPKLKPKAAHGDDQGDDDGYCHSSEVKHFDRSSRPGRLTYAYLAEKAPIKIKIELEPRFNVFPERLRLRVEMGIEYCEYARLFAYRNDTYSNKPPAIRYRYTVVHVPRADTTHRDSSSEESFGDVNIANAELMEHLLSEASEIVEKANFVYTENPDCANAHSAKEGDLLWGFDADGFLSFKYTSVKEHGLVEEAWYIVRSKIRNDSGADA